MMNTNYGQRGTLNLLGIKHCGPLLMLSCILVAPNGFCQKLAEKVQQPRPDQPVLVNVTNSPPPKDTFQQLDRGIVAPTGWLAYRHYIPIAGGKSDQTYLTLRQFGTVRSVVTYQLSSEESIYNPQFSPNGEYLLFKVGWPFDRMGQFRFYLLDLKKQTIINGPDVPINNLKLQWSPDSRYISYVTGGDIEGVPLAGYPLQLHIFDVKTGRDRYVAKDIMQITAAWSSDNTLLFSRTPDNQSPRDAQIPRPNIFEFSLNGQDAKTIIREALRPLPSPDNMWLIYVGWPSVYRANKNTKGSAQEAPAGPSFFLYNRKEKTRVPLPTITSNDTIHWSNNSKSFIILRHSYKAGVGTCEISTFDVASQQQKAVAILRANDYKSIPRMSLQPQFELIEISGDGKTLVFQVSEYTRHATDGAYSIVESSLRSVNTTNGEMADMAKIETVMGIDFKGEQDESQIPK